LTPDSLGGESFAVRGPNIPEKALKLTMKTHSIGFHWSGYQTSLVGKTLVFRYVNNPLWEKSLNSFDKITPIWPWDASV
jgi:hypothetical protein